MGINDKKAPKICQTDDRGRVSKVLKYLKWAIPSWRVSIFKGVTVQFSRKVVQKFPSLRIRTNTFEGTRCYTQILSHGKYDLKSWIRNKWSRKDWSMLQDCISSLQSTIYDLEYMSSKRSRSRKVAPRTHSSSGTTSDRGSRARCTYDLERHVISGDAISSNNDVRPEMLKP